jgi:anti-sigma B factor antagonist
MIDSPVRSFRLLERDLDAGCREIGVEGELDMSVADELKEALRGARERACVLIDLRSCEFIDSTGIALIVEAHNEMEGEGRIAVHGASGQVLRVLQVTGLTENGLAFQTAAEALAERGQSDLDQG